MKSWLVLCLVAILGVCLGSGTVLVQLRWWPFKGIPTDAGQLGADHNSPPDENAADGHPKVAIDEEVYDFGAMDSEEWGYHEFVITNKGDAPLKIKRGESSCKCTIAELRNSKVLPGQSTKVGVKWTGKDAVGPFRHTAAILANDPDRPQVVLTIQGRMTAKVRAVPSELVFSRVAAGSSAIGRVKLFCYLPKPMEIVGIELFDGEHFEVTYEPLAGDQLEEEENATSGYLIEATVKSGLPLGAFQQTIRLKTNLEEVATFEIPVKGMVAGEISILGPGWSEKRSVLLLGTIRSHEARKRTLMIRVVGPYAEEVKFKPVEVVPDLLKVRLGETILPGSGRIALTPLEIEIPKGSPPTNHLGPDREDYGHITIETTHPEARELKILVQFAVRG